MVSEDHRPRGVSTKGLTGWATINVFAFLYLFMEGLGPATYKSGGSLNFAEAAYLNSQWTKLAVGWLALIAFNTIVAAFVIAHRLDRLHAAQQYTRNMTRYSGETSITTSEPKAPLPQAPVGSVEKFWPHKTETT